MALRDTYESIEDYIERSSTDIYKPLMKLADSIGATEVQKQILRNTIEGILQDKKMIVPYDNTENENCVSYRTIEDKVGIKLNIDAITLLSSFCNTYLYNKVEEKQHSIIIGTHNKPKCAYFWFPDEDEKDDSAAEKNEKEVKKPVFIDEKTAAEMVKEGENVYISYCGKVEKYNGKEIQETMYYRFVDGNMIPSYEVSDEIIKKYADFRKEMGLSEGEIIVPDNIANYQELISLMGRIKEKGYYDCFEILLNSKLMRNLPSQSKLSDTDKSYIEKFKKVEDSDGYIEQGVYSEVLLTPLSFLKDYEETPGLEDDEKGKEIVAHIREASKKVNGLRECIDDIITSFNSGSIGNISTRNSFFGKSQINLKERFERILVQGIIDGLITDKDYFECMATMQCMMELNKVRLSPEETLSYVIESAGGTPSNNTKTKEQKTL